MARNRLHAENGDALRRKIRDLLEARGMTASDACRAAGFRNCTFLTNFLSGYSASIRLFVAQQLARGAFDMSLSELLGESTVAAPDVLKRVAELADLVAQIAEAVKRIEAKRRHSFAKRLSVVQGIAERIERIEGAIGTRHQTRRPP